MAAVTAAVVTTAATAASVGMQAYSASQQGGGAPTKPNMAQTPEDPQDRAMRDYYARLQVANVKSKYPAFSDYLQSGGDPSKAEFPLIVPELKPSEAAALGFVGGKGEDIPGLTQEELASGETTHLTPEQTIYLAKERRGQAAQAGQDPGPWAANMGNVGGRIRKTEKRLGTLQAIEEPKPRQTRRIENLTERLARLKARQEALVNKGSED